MRQARCANDNHGRNRVTVRFCCTCGSVLNESIPSARCADAEHAELRRSQHAYCMRCGTQLAVARGVRGRG